MSSSSPPSPSQPPSSPPHGEHSIALPLVSKDQETARLPLVINVVARYWGEDIPTNNDHHQQQKTGSRGALMIDGIELAESHGLAGYIYKSSIKDLKKRIDQGIPPIAIVPGIHETVQHATIISGYNSDERRILTYVPEPDTVGAIPEARFEQDWDQDDMTAIILVPSDMKQDLLRNESLKFKDSNRICFEAERLRQSGKANEAIARLQKGVEMDPDNAQAWCMLAGVYNELGSDQASQCYEKAASLNPRYYLAYRGLGNYYLKKKDYLRAESYYTKAIEINPARFGPIYKNRAVARMQIGSSGGGNQQGAKQDLQVYLEQTPGAQDAASIREAIAQM